MKCSECSGIITPVVAIDIDGTLGNYYYHFSSFFSSYYNVHIPHEYTGATEYWEYFKSMGFSRNDYREAKLAYRQGGQKRTMPCFQGARELTNDLHKKGVEIWITTSRPYLRLDNIDPDTREWLRRNDIHYDGMIYGKDKYSQLMNNLGKSRIVTVLDDLPEMFDQAKVLGLDPIQMGRIHNSSNASKREPRVLHLQAAQQLIERKVEAWSHRNGSQERQGNSLQSSTEYRELAKQLTLPVS